MTIDYDASIPVLHDVLVPGDPAKGAAAPRPLTLSDIARGAAIEPTAADDREDALAPGEPRQTQWGTPALDVGRHAASDEDDDELPTVGLPELTAILTPGDPLKRRPAVRTSLLGEADEADVGTAPMAAAGDAGSASSAAPAGFAVDEMAAADGGAGATDDAVPADDDIDLQAFDPDAPPPAAAPAPQSPAVPPAPAPRASVAAPKRAAAAMPLRAEGVADRLRGRLANYLTGEGRMLIEAHCRDALADHTAWLVHQVTREVALVLEAEVSGWVREAVQEEFERLRIEQAQAPDET